MANLVNITITEQVYKDLLLIKEFHDAHTISVKVLPDDIILKEDIMYQILIKAYKKARNTMEKYRFNKLNGK